MIKAIGAAIRDRRESLGLTKQEAAKRAGITQTTVKNIESGEPCNTGKLARLLAVLGAELRMVPVERWRDLHADDSQPSPDADA